MKFFQAIKHVYRKFLPDHVRSTPFFRKLKTGIYKLFPLKSLIYDDFFYENSNYKFASRSVSVMSASIIESLNPSTVIDIGCGAGLLLTELKNKGVSGLGLEYSSAGVTKCMERGLQVRQFNILKDSIEGSICFDLAVCMEVAEHLSAKSADYFIDFLVKLSDSIVFTAAQPGQGGIGHLNEQPKEYWIEKFERRGFVLDQEMSKKWASDWKRDGNVAKWYYRNLIIARRF